MPKELRKLFLQIWENKYQKKLEQLQQELKRVYDEERQREEQRAVKCIKKTLILKNKFLMKIKRQRILSC